VATPESCQYGVLQCIQPHRMVSTHTHYAHLNKMFAGVWTELETCVSATARYGGLQHRVGDLGVPCRPTTAPDWRGRHEAGSPATAERATNKHSNSRQSRRHDHATLYAGSRSFIAVIRFAFHHRSLLRFTRQLQRMLRLEARTSCLRGFTTPLPGPRSIVVVAAIAP
jgi:hypothetical protein